MEPRWGVLTVPQTAKLLQMSDDRVYRLIQNGLIPGAMNIDGQYRVSAQVLYQWFNGRWHGPWPPEVPSLEAELTSE